MGKTSAFEILDPYTEKVINNYINYRSKGGVIIYNNFKANKNISHKEKNLKISRDTIARAIQTIILGRFSIVWDRHKNLSLKENNLIKEYNFDLLDLTKQDYFYLAERYASKTLYSMYAELRPFYYWLLQDLDEDSDISFESYQKFKKVEKRIIAFLNQFPARNEINNYLIHERKQKSFLTRKQMINVKNILFNNPRSRTPFRDAIVWQLCCVTGIRPEELVHIKIEYFNTDQNGLLILNNRGWGILDIPREISKKQNSPSHETYKTPIPSSTVTDLNNYLRYIYRLQPKSVPLGKGYLFRPDLNEIEKRYKDKFMNSSIRRIKEELTFLSSEQRRDFELKAARRTLNNLIMGYDVELPINRKVQEIAANYQMRHTPRMQSVAEKHYTDLISEDDFYKALEYTIDFPWDYSALKVWEIKHGYLEVENKVYYQEITSERKNNVVESDYLKKVKDRLDELKTRPKSMSVLEWTTERSNLLKEIEALEVK